MSRNTLSAKIISLSLLFVLLFAIIAPTQAQAGVFGSLEDDIKEKLEEGFQDGSISCVAAAAVAALFSYLASALTNVPTTPVPEVIKEQIMDCVFWAIKNKIVEEITEKTVGYVQTGMNGNPAFAQNVQQYLLSVTDRAAGEYISQTTTGDFLCSPYRGEIQQALTEHYQKQSGRGSGAASPDTTSCTLAETVTDIDAFVGGDFYAGGWNAWTAMFMDSYNNPFGAYVETKAELDRKVEAAKEEAKVKLEQGEGYYGKEAQNCYEVPVMNQDGTNSSFTECDPPKTETPGATVKDAFEQTYGVTMDELANADELSELIVLWMSHMVTDMLTGEKGLSGYDPADFEHEVPDFEISDEDWDDIDIGPGPVGANGCYPEPWESFPLTAGTPGPQINEGLSSFTSTAGDATYKIDMDNMGPNKNYSRVTAEFDVTVGTFGPGGSQYNLFWLHRAEKWQANNVIEVVYSSNNGGRLRLSTSVNLNNGPSCALGYSNGTGFGGFTEGETYHVTINYDPAGTNKMSVEIDGPGGHDAWIQQDTTVEMLQSNNPRTEPQKSGFHLTLGGDANPNGDEGLTDGWVWSNLHIHFEPGSETTGGGGGGGGGQDPQDPTP